MNNQIILSLLKVLVISPKLASIDLLLRLTLKNLQGLFPALKSYLANHRLLRVV